MLLEEILHTPALDTQDGKQRSGHAIDQLCIDIVGLSWDMHCIGRHVHAFEGLISSMCLVFVWMKLQRQLPVCFLYVILPSIPLQAEHSVEVRFFGQN